MRNQVLPQKTKVTPELASVGLFRICLPFPSSITQCRRHQPAMFYEVIPKQLSDFSTLHSARVLDLTGRAVESSVLYTMIHKYERQGYSIVDNVMR